MRCRKLILTVIIALTATKRSNAQDILIPESSESIPTTHVTKSNEVRPLKVGDKIPDNLFENVINFSGNSLRLTDFKGKLVILDFWSTYCAICIKLFPKMEALQSKFGDKLAIITVGFNVANNTEVEDFLIKRKADNKELTLPTIVQKKTDNTLSKMFPFDSLPHEVWIGTDGTILGITESDAVTEKNIRNILEGQRLAFDVKKEASSLNWDTPFLFGKLQQGHYGSAFCGFVDSISAGQNPFGYQRDSSFWRFYDVNMTPVSYYANVYSFFVEGLTKKRIVIVNNDKPFYKDFSDIVGKDNWITKDFRRNDLFGYELILPRSYNLTEVHQWMIQDFDRYFKVKSSIENRKIKCLALVTTATTKKGDISNQTINNINDNPRGSFPIVEFVKILDAQIKDKRPILNETKGITSIEMSDELISINDLEKMKKSLSKYQMDLVEVERVMPVVVLKNLR